MKFFSFHTAFLAALTGLTFTGLSENVNAQSFIPPDQDSEIRIEGRSNVNRFTCNAEQYEGGIEVTYENSGQMHDRLNEAVELALKIPVRSLECGRNRMNRDLYNALKSDDFSHISFKLRDARNLTEAETEKAGTENKYHLEVAGVLTVAGTSNTITFTATGFLLENGRMRVTGQKKILMTDYNVEPPTGLLGLVRAENELTVYFDLFASPEESLNFSGVSR